VNVTSLVLKVRKGAHWPIPAGKSSEISAVLVASLVVGGIVLVFLVSIIVIWVCRRKSFAEGAAQLPTLEEPLNQENQVNDTDRAQ
jgi:Mn2+/Fe2+ NRAMP family transporter